MLSPAAIAAEREAETQWSSEEREEEEEEQEEEEEEEGGVWRSVGHRKG